MQDPSADPTFAVMDFSSSPVNRALSAEEKIGFYRSMVRIRRFEHLALGQYQKDKMGGFLHLYIGQEAVAVGAVSLMGADDHVITAYRDHGHALAVGMSMEECMAELFGKANGCSKGKGGSLSQCLSLLHVSQVLGPRRRDLLCRRATRPIGRAPSFLAACGPLR